MIFISAIGQDSHRFVNEETSRSPRRCLILGGVEIPGTPPLEGNSDADVVLHALTNALSGLSAVPVLGKETDKLCEAGITDSSLYVRVALETLGDIRLTHLSFSIEAKRPHLAEYIVAMREKIAKLTGLPAKSVAITATSGEGLTAFGRGEGIACICIASAILKKYPSSFQGSP